jgi:hypothetical protein
VQFAGIYGGAGKVQVDSGATLQFNVSAVISGNVTDNGTIVAHAGGLEIGSGSSITGTGGFKIDAGAVLQFDGADALNVLFTGSTGELVLKDPADFSGTIGNSSGHLTSGNLIDLTNINPTTAHLSGPVTYTSGNNISTVSITDGTHTDILHLVGDYTTSTWTFAADGSGGTIVDDPPGTSDPAQIGDTFHFAETAGDHGSYAPAQHSGPSVPPPVQTLAEILSEGAWADLHAEGLVHLHHDATVTTVQKNAPLGDFFVHG